MEAKPFLPWEEADWEWLLSEKRLKDPRTLGTIEVGYAWGTAERPQTQVD